MWSREKTIIFKMAYCSDGFMDFATGVKEKKEGTAVVVSDPAAARLLDQSGANAGVPID